MEERGAALRQAVAQAGGLTEIDRMLATRRDLTRADHEMLRSWRDDAVRGVFEVRATGRHAVTVLNLEDDLGYRVYGELGEPGQLRSGMFVSGTLLPLTADDADDGAWLAS